ncbi:DUF305 domain-containing protein [Streptomyces sp. NBC_01754]|uniref:DUF305 domain-containing protein n=1 Tax=Streptomyces sp. NBC_01754 TaxID=2975930 RepID=UPI002DDBFA4E|nr:DUF305 domain-containing protein [Streptomyces sp. NBC_01754]WSC95932.1 DUF305 domain-containing protein [Streptomyces sp. NBC_01754]
MNTARRTVAPLLLGLVLLTGTTACSTGPAPDPGATAPPRPTTAPAPSADPTDTGWLQLMIPMDEGAVALLDLAARKASDPVLRSFSARLRTAQEAELAALRGLRGRMGLPDTDVHEGHEMPGMVTARDLERARAAEGAAFDRLLVTEIGDHLRQSARVSRSQTTAGSSAEAKERATALVAAREDQLAELAELPGAQG